jgi:hypothetical protein
MILGLFEENFNKCFGQSRVAKMEAADTSVTMDLLFRSLFALGASKRNVVGMLADK